MRIGIELKKYDDIRYMLTLFPGNLADNVDAALNWLLTTAKVRVDAECAAASSLGATLSNSPLDVSSRVTRAGFPDIRDLQRVELPASARRVPETKKPIPLPTVPCAHAA